jgi:hypothetical protein
MPSTTFSLEGEFVIDARGTLLALKAGFDLFEVPKSRLRKLKITTTATTITAMLLSFSIDLPLSIVTLGRPHD